MPESRRHDIDFLRVIAFDLLILYHVGMFFVPWGWHVKNNELTEGIIPLMIFLNQWRLPLLFVISGMGTSFALSSRSGGAYIGERSLRLLIPLVFGILVVIPPQVYFERLAQGISFDSFFDFYPHFFDGIYPSGNFSWHHLWFLPYLYFFSVAFAPVFLAIRRSKGNWCEKTGKFLKKYPLAIFLAAIPLIIVEIAMRPHFPVTMAFWGDWYAMAKYALLFFYGFLFISIKDYFFEPVERIKFFTLISGMIFILVLLGGQKFGLPREILAPVKILNMLCWILTLTGFASKYLNRPGRYIIYRNKTVYPFYILHQTITVAIGYFIAPIEWAIGFKFLVLTIVTFGGSFMIYELIISKIRPLRFVFGVK